jgi:hypothetical protein
MIPNVLNTILGIALVYCAILAPALMNATASLPAAGVGIIALGFWARRSDKINWFNVVNTILGAALVLLGIGRTLTAVHPLIMFWWVFWVGIIVAVLALWSVLYTPDASATASYQP